MRIFHEIGPLYLSSGTSRWVKGCPCGVLEVLSESNVLHRLQKTCCDRRRTLRSLYNFVRKKREKSTKIDF